MKHLVFSHSSKQNSRLIIIMNINNNANFSNIICLFNEAFNCWQQVAITEAFNEYEKVRMWRQVVMTSCNKNN